MSQSQSIVNLCDNECCRTIETPITHDASRFTSGRWLRARAVQGTFLKFCDGAVKCGREDWCAGLARWLGRARESGGQLVSIWCANWTVSEGRLGLQVVGLKGEEKEE